MADEEDVVFVNSPLYEHLAEVGYTDFDGQSMDGTTKQDGTNVDSSVPLKSYQEAENRTFYTAIDSVKEIYGLISYLFIPSTISKEIACYSSYVYLIKSSKLMTDDDLEFVYKFEQCMSETETLKNCTNDVNGTASTGQNIRSRFTLLTSHVFIGLLAIIAIILGSISTASHSLGMILLITLAVFLFASKIYAAWWYNRIDSLHHHNILLISQYLQVIEELLLLIRKAVLFIQEKELLARGHIILSPMVPISRMELNSTVHGPKFRQCIMLRKCIFSETKGLVDDLHSKTKALSTSKLFENNKMLSWLDKDLRIIDTEWLNLGPDVDTTVEANKFSLASLKKMFGCLVSQQSLLLCYVILKLLSVINNLEQWTKRGSNLDVIQNCFKHILDKANKCLDKVRCCYRFHKVDIPPHILDKEGAENLGNKLTTTFSPFFMAIHSMNLHLQEATKTSVSLEEKLEGINTKTDSEQGFVLEHYDEFDKVLMHIKSDIDSLTSCWKESHKKLQDIFLSFGVKKEMKESSQENMGDEKLEDQDNSNVQVFNITRNVGVVPDQVFEGETCSGLDDEREFPSTVDREEIFTEQKIKEENRCLLQELKSVLATKDEQTMVGIPRALLLKKIDDSDSKFTVQNLDDNITDRSMQNQASFICQAPESYKDQSQCDGFEPGRNVDKCSSYHPEASTDTYDHLGFTSETERSTVVNPFASMVAAAALARNQEFGMKEQSYEIAGESETTGDESNSNDE